MAAMTIVMDEVTYNVGITFPSMSRSFSFIEGQNAGMALSGRTILDTIGTNYSYTMEVHPIKGQQASYDAFFEAISSPSRTHEITLPYGQTTKTFSCYILGGSDKLMDRVGSSWKWGGMTVQFVPIAPQRT